MDDGEILPLGQRNFDPRSGFGKRLRGEKCERQVRHGFTKLGTSGAVPGINFVEVFEQRAPCRSDA